MRSRILTAFLSLCGGSLLAGCEDRACSIDLLRPDGGPYRCVAPEDCPRRTSDVFVCLNNGWPDKNCVRCTETQQCVEISTSFCH